MRPRRTGFTLIELLVVIAIIAILAAILFPVFVTAKERGRQAKCLCNLKQLMIGIREYCDDNNGFMPFGEQQNHVVPDWAGCYYCGVPGDVKNGGLYKYVRNRAVYTCPSDLYAHTGIPGWTFSYSMNFRICTDMYLGQLTKLDTETAGRTARVLILIHENRGGGKHGGGINDGFFAWGNTCDFPSDVHWNGTTVVYADCHAKWGSYKQLIGEMNAGHWLPNSLGGT